MSLKIILLSIAFHAFQPVESRCFPLSTLKGVESMESGKQMPVALRAPTSTRPSPMHFLIHPPTAASAEQPVEVRNPVHRYRVVSGQTFERDGRTYLAGSAVLARENEAAPHMGAGALALMIG